MSPFVAHLKSTTFTVAQVTSEYNYLVVGGGKRDRTADPLLARQVLSQLSYTPKKIGKIPISENKCL